MKRCSCGSPADEISFDRSICACGAMHYYCEHCGAQSDPCLSDPLATMNGSPEGTSGRRNDGFALPVNGRPHTKESQRRALYMAELVAAGWKFRVAAAEAGVKPARALDLVESPDWVSLVNGLRDAA